MLHQAHCHTINGTPARGIRWTADYMKVCSDDPAAIQHWITGAIAGGHATECQICFG
jgi:hypothetical protein